MRSHVDMHQLLQVDAEAVSVGSHHHIRADTTVARHVAARIGQFHVGRIVGNCDANLAFGSSDQLRGPRPGHAEDWRGRSRYGRLPELRKGIDVRDRCDSDGRCAGDTQRCEKRPAVHIATKR